jgi:hypothetical protein
MEKDIFWKNLPIDEYARFLKYLPIGEQLAFMEQFSAKQQAKLLEMLPSEQQTRLLMHFTMAQNTRVLDHLPPWRRPNVMGQWEMEGRMPFGFDKPLSEKERARLEQARAEMAAAAEDIRARKQAYDLRRAQDGEQGPVGERMADIAAKIVQLPQELQDMNAKSIMAVLEMTLGSGNPDDLKAMGLSENDVDGLAHLGLPVILFVLFGEFEPTREMLDKLLSDMGKGMPQWFADKVYKVAGGTMINNMSVVSALAGGLVKKALLGDALDAGSRHLDLDPCIRVDTDRLRAYASRLRNLVSRLQDYAASLRRRANHESVKADGERNDELIKRWNSLASQLVSGVADMQKIASFLDSAAQRFESAESNILRYAKEENVFTTAILCIFSNLLYLKSIINYTKTAFKCQCKIFIDD